MNVISFSLWGDNPLYNIGAIKNADRALEIYPDWMCYYYCNKCVPQETINELNKRKNIKIIYIDKIGNTNSAINRFFAVNEPGVKRVIFRDTDSRLSQREKLAVNQWIDSAADIHLMRDHPAHGWFVQAGMFGLKPDKFKDIELAANSFYFSNTKGEDQNFMSAYLKNKISKEGCSYIEHDPFYSKIPFPNGAKRGRENDGVFFVGQRIEILNQDDIYYSNIYDEVIKDVI